MSLCRKLSLPQHGSGRGVKTQPRVHDGSMQHAESCIDQDRSAHGGIGVVSERAALLELKKIPIACGRCSP